MNIDRAKALLAELTDLAEQRDEAGLQSFNLPPGALLALSRYLGIGKEVQQLERLLERREADERQAEADLLALLQQLP